MLQCLQEANQGEPICSSCRFKAFPHCYHSSESMKICLKSLGVENENSVDFSLAVILTCILFLLTGTVENI